MTDTDMLYMAAQGKRITELENENRELKRLLKEAINDIGSMSRYCSGFNCDHCPHIRTTDKGYQWCVWQHAFEASKLVFGGKENDRS